METNKGVGFQRHISLGRGGHAVGVSWGGRGSAIHDRKQTTRWGQDSKTWPIIDITKMIIIESPEPLSCPSLMCFSVCVFGVRACVRAYVLTVSLKETVGCGSLLTRDSALLLSLPTDWH